MGSEGRKMDLDRVDVAIVGGGLSGALTAYFMAEARPERSIALFESSDRLGGNHTWSFHESDISAPALELLKPFISRSWSATSVEFPRVKKTIEGAYHSIRSEDLDRVLREKLEGKVLFNSEVEKLSDTSVTLSNGDIVEASVVLDARGLDQLPPAGINGYQKFIGYDVTLEEPHGLETPMLMDATCPQLEGYRFFYLLPWDQTRLLVEETYYSDTPDLNDERISRSIRSYIERRDWTIKSIDREESGVLPIPLTSENIKTSVSGEAVPIGMRAGFFHSTTGYTVADTVRFAEYLAKATDPKSTELTTQGARDGLARFRRPWLSRQRFYRLLNRLLFQASEPSLRYVVFQRFYELSDDLIQRFYAGRTTWTDRLRILSGKPPVPVSEALKHFSERSAVERIGTIK